MTSRETRTGADLEAMVALALKRGGYNYKHNALIGRRLGAGRHLVDFLAWDDAGRHYLIACKWQQVGGTAEQKVPFEVISLIHAIVNSPEKKYKRAYIVIGGLLLPITCKEH